MSLLDPPGVSRIQADTLYADALWVPVADGLGLTLNPPTISTVNSATSQITSPQQITPDNPAIRYTGPALSISSTEAKCTDASSNLVSEFWSNSPQVGIFVLRFNTKMDIRVDGELMQPRAIALDAAGSGYEVMYDWSTTPTRGTVPATSTMTFTGQPTNGQTVTIGSKVWTFQTTLTDVDGNVLIGASTTLSVRNLFDAINNTNLTRVLANAATTYAPSGTESLDVTAIQNGTTLILTARRSGIAGNSVATTTSVTGASFTGATLAGGAGAGEPNPRKPRLYRITGFNVRLQRIRLQANTDIWSPGPFRTRLAYFFGDSYTQNTGSAGPDQTYARTIGDRLGYDIYSDGIGGAGWLSVSTSAPLTRIAARMAQLQSAFGSTVSARTIDLIVNAMGYNDKAGDITAMGVSFAACLTQEKNYCGKIISLPPWTPLGTTVQLDSVHAALSTQAAAAGTYYATNAYGGVTSSNAQFYTDADNTHPLWTLGHSYVGHRNARGIRDLGLKFINGKAG